MNRILAVLFALMLVLSGCLGDGEAIEEPVENLLDTDGDGIPNVDDEDDDGDSWSDLDELNCNSDPLVATDLPSDIDGDGACDVRDSDDDGDTWTDIDELACGSDPLVASDVPLDEDNDGTCDFLDEDSDGDSFADGTEQLCGSDPLDATSTPADMDGDGVCDAMDDDIDGDGVANDDDFAPEDPDKSEAITGCTDATAFNYNEDAEVDDASCFTLEDAEDAIMTAFEGIMSTNVIDYSDGIQSIAVMDTASEAISLTLGYLQTEDGEIMTLAAITYVNDGSGYVEVDMNYPETDEYGDSTGVMLNELYKVNAAYYSMNMDDRGWSHCEYDGINWYCTDLHDDEDESQLFNGESRDETYHLFTCADGETVLLSTVNDGAEDCADGSDEPKMEDDGRTYTCNDGSEIAFSLANDNNEDCDDGSDEENFIESFDCNDGTYLPSYALNDGYDDCQDGEDEPYYDMDQYETSTYTCEDGTTVPLSDVNDDVDDCPDGTDETPTDGDKSELFSFVCGGEDDGDDHGDHDDHDDHDGEEIPLSMVNDGSEDCDDGSDEPAYDEDGEEINQYTCYNFHTHQSTTLNISQVNDGTIDCELRMDESAAAGNETERWFGIDDQEEGDFDEYTGECVLDGSDFEVPWSWVNDGIDDCDDGTDEPAYDENGVETSVITCYDGTEIALSLANDGTEDCTEGEDETTWELMSMYTCDDGETVEFEWVNDEHDDCHDGSDEPTYDIDELTDFTCDDGSTIPFSQANDGHDDCADAEDEPVFEDVEVTTFECASGDEIYLSEVNDGTEDCPGADDEPSYDPITQSEVSTYTCEFSGETIALSSVNDEEEDCEDGTDEPYYYYDETSVFMCAGGEFEIPLSSVNNGEGDCQDRSDEAQYDITDESVLICNDGSEITVSQFNDGVDDCTDGSDEQDYFVCEDGSYTLPFSYINDGWSYCDDGSDESVIEDVNIVQCMGGDDEIPASSFRDDNSDCESGWDEMDFEMVSDCEWDEGIGWICGGVYLDPAHEWTMLMETDENGLEMIVLTAQTEIALTAEKINATVAFDAASHAFLFMKDTEFDAGGALEMESLMVSSTYDPSLLDELVVDTSLDTHAPPWAVEFYGEPLPAEDDRTFLCDDETESVPFASINDGAEDCGDGSDEPVYEVGEEMSEFYCNADDEVIYLSQVNDGVADCSDSEDEDDGTGTQEYQCLYSGDVILFANVNDGAFDCEDETDEPYYEGEEISDFPCEDGEENIPLSYVNDGDDDCQDGSDEAPEGEGYGYGEYMLFTVGTGEWTMGEGETMLEVVFSSCDTFTYVSSDISGASYDLPSECGEDLARYTFDEIMNGEVAGLEFYDYGDGQTLLYLDEDFELEGWNALRLSTPSGEYADENPEVVLPAPGIGFALVAMLGAAMLASRRNE